MCGYACACRHTLRFMVTWLVFLPWALWEDCQWLTIPITGIITFLLLGIENIGIQVWSPLCSGLTSSFVTY